LGNLILVTGGGRSGKSAYAQEIAEALGGRKIFLATCPPVDEEMVARIRRHEQARAGRGWETIEETLDLAGALRQIVTCDVILVDCLTLWINNLMYEAEKSETKIDEDEMSEIAEDLVSAARAAEFPVIMVTNEVGMGIVPEHPSVRLYRDLVGRCNQVAARGADRVVLMVSGMSIEMKQGDL
jgi:adenosylcobinamide kinase/adenosylcobinamide-phosphate guanylyltransferase